MNAKLIGVSSLVLWLATFGGIAQTTVFTYQGQLSDNGAPASGRYDLRFTLHTVANGAGRIGPVLDANNVSIANGYFTVPLDFGAGVFTGPDRWLEIAVRPTSATTPHTVLAPRQAITSTPYALHSASTSNLLGQVSDAQIPATIARLNTPSAFTGAVIFSPLFGPPFAVNSTNKVAQLNADLFDNLDAAAFARVQHNHSAADLVSGTVPDTRLSANVAMLASHQVFGGSNRFAGILVATNSGNVFAGNGGGLTNLNSANLTGILPSAILPSGVARLSSNQTFSGVVTFAPNSGAPFRVSSGTLVTNLNADQLDGLSASAFWTTAGNTNATFLGTIDNAPLELRVNNSRGLRLLPHTLGSTMIAGHPGNSAPTTVGGAVIVGGSNNSVSNHYAFVAAGSGNRATGQSASVGGGDNNAATNSAAVVPGGTGNLAGGVNSLAAGAGAHAVHANTFVWADASSTAPFVSTAPNQVLFRATGGVGIGTNTPRSTLHVAGSMEALGFKLTTSPQTGWVLVSDADGNGTWQQPAVRAQANSVSPNVLGGHASNSIVSGVVGATISGGGAPGASNQVAANYGAIGGGNANAVTGLAGVVSGGEANRASSRWATVAGGSNNTAGGTNSTVAGGQGNLASGAYAAVGGGRTNAASGLAATVAGGQMNQASAQAAFVGGGNTNQATGVTAVVVGGDRNYASGPSSFIGGGVQNTNTGISSVIGGGRLNRVTNDYAVVPGGENNVAGGLYSFAAGRRAQALHAGSFVWADFSTTTAFSSTAPNQFLLRAAGGVGIGGAPEDALLDVEGDLRLNDSDLLLRGGTDRNTGLGWFGASHLFAGQNVDGPVLYGQGGGGLGTRGGTLENIVLTWKATGRVGIGTNSPAHFLHVVAPVPSAAEFASTSDQGTSLSLRNLATGGEAWRLHSSGSGQPLGAGHFQILDGNSARLTINPEGSIGIGTVVPRAKLELYGADTTLNIRNQNDAIGGFVQNTFSSLQLGLYNPGTANSGQVGIGAKRSFFGFNNDGLVGSLVNNSGSPSFRNLLDDGSGNMRVSDAGALSFGSSTRQMLNLWSANYGIGVQGNTLYFRTDANMAWYRFGAHNSSELNAGAGGRELMRLNDTALRVRGAGSEDVYIGGDAIGNDAQFGSYNSNIVNAVFWNPARGETMNLTVKALNETSDRDQKHAFAEVDAQAVLAKVTALPVQSWQYKGEDQIRHVGPTAQDFHAAFGLGSDDKHIATVDAGGVALVSIQALHELLKEKQARIDSLEARLAALEKRFPAVATAKSGGANE